MLIELWSDVCAIHRETNKSGLEGNENDTTTTTNCIQMAMTCGDGGGDQVCLLAADELNYAAFGSSVWHGK